MRMLPELADDNRFFWTSGEDGQLRFLRCSNCQYFVHPPAPICPQCLCRELSPEPVSGKATVVSYTVNHQKWHPAMEVPFIIAVVECEEQSDLNLTTNLVNVDCDAVTIGMEVQVTFEQDGEIYIPLFEPAHS